MHVEASFVVTLSNRFRGRWLDLIVKSSKGLSLWMNLQYWMPLCSGQFHMKIIVCG